MYKFPPLGFPGGSVSKESVCDAEDPGSILGSGRSPGGGHGNRLQYSCLPWTEEPGSLQSIGSQSRTPLKSVAHTGFLGGTCGKEPTFQCRRPKRQGFNPWVRKIPWSRKWQSTPVFLPGKFHGQRSLAGYSPWGHKESDTTEHTHITIILKPIISSLCSK